MFNSGGSFSSISCSRKEEHRKYSWSVNDFLPSRNVYTASSESCCNCCLFSFRDFPLDEQKNFDFFSCDSRQFTTLILVTKNRLKPNNFGETSTNSSLFSNKNSITFRLTVHFDFSCKLFVALARSSHVIFNINFKCCKRATNQRIENLRSALEKKVSPGCAREILCQLARQVLGCGL